MKRLCVFAHWDRDNIVDDYIIYYLKALKEVCSTIIFVSDTDGTDVSCLDGIADYCLVKKHGEYDFGSYKRGFFYALENNIEFEELLFVNDSCYGPFYTLQSIFDKMAEKKCDWWGLTRNSYGIEKKDNKYVSFWFPHIQSYFLLFKSSVFSSEVFMNFMKNIETQSEKNEVIVKYEMGLSRVLSNFGFRSAFYINKFSHTYNPIVNKWDRMIRKHKFPFLKTEVPKRGLFIEGGVKNWDKVINSVSDYPIELISKNANRQLNFQQNLYKDMNLYRKIRYKVLKNLPCECRQMLVYIEKNLFIVLNTICFNKLEKF